MSSRTLYLRNPNGDTLVDIEVGDFDIHAVVCIKPYSQLLLLHQVRCREVIDLFDQLQEIRGWYWERFLHEWRS